MTGLVQPMSFTSSDNVAVGTFGASSVDLEGDAIVVGAHGRNGYAAGALHIFALNETKTSWEETDIIRASGGAISYAYFGLSVALSGNRITVGAPFANNNNSQAYIFAGPDFVETELLQCNSTRGDTTFLGISVAMFGDTAVVGAERNDTYKDTSYDIDKGASYVFK
jgi:hypothetical protein